MNGMTTMAWALGALAMLATTACGSYPAPHNQMADTESAAGAAVGANAKDSPRRRST